MVLRFSDAPPAEVGSSTGGRGSNGLLLPELRAGLPRSTADSVVDVGGAAAQGPHSSRGGGDGKKRLSSIYTPVPTFKLSRNLSIASFDGGGGPPSTSSSARNQGKVRNKTERQPTSARVEFALAGSPKAPRPTTPVERAMVKIAMKRVEDRILDTETYIEQEKEKHHEWTEGCKAETLRWLRSRGKLVRPDGLRSDVKMQIQEWFELVDDDRSGTLEDHELVSALRTAGIPCNLSSVNELVSLCDLNHDGCISWDEFELFLSNEFAAGKSLLDGEYILPSGEALPFASMIAKLRRNKLMADVISGGESRKMIVRKADEEKLNSEAKKKGVLRLPTIAKVATREDRMRARAELAAAEVAEDRETRDKETDGNWAAAHMTRKKLQRVNTSLHRRAAELAVAPPTLKLADDEDEDTRGRFPTVIRSKLSTELPIRRLCSQRVPPQLRGSETGGLVSQASLHEESSGVSIDADADADPGVLAPGGVARQASPHIPPTTVRLDLPPWLTSTPEDAYQLGNKLLAMAQLKIAGRRQRKRRNVATNPYELFGWSDVMTLPPRRTFAAAAVTIAEYKADFPYLPSSARGPKVNRGAVTMRPATLA